jgi:hypothetical protein
MTDDTQLLRQVHPTWIKGDNLLSLAFRPFPKDEGLVSVYDGDQISPEASWRHFTRQYSSVGAWAVTPRETLEIALPARLETEGYFSEHCVIDYTAHDEKQQKAKSKILTDKAQKRGCLYKAVDPGCQAP